jgi:hypothetical protein
MALQEDKVNTITITSPVTMNFFISNIPFQIQCHNQNNTGSGIVLLSFGFQINTAVFMPKVAAVREFCLKYSSILVLPSFFAPHCPQNIGLPQFQPHIIPTVRRSFRRI